MPIRLASSRVLPAEPVRQRKDSLFEKTFLARRAHFFFFFFLFCGAARIFRARHQFSPPADQQAAF